MFLSFHLLQSFSLTMNSSSHCPAQGCFATHLTCPSRMKSCSVQCLNNQQPDLFVRLLQQLLTNRHRFVVIHRVLACEGIEQVIVRMVEFWWTKEKLLHSGVLDIETMRVHHFSGFDPATATFIEVDFHEFQGGHQVYWEKHSTGTKQKQREEER